MDEFHLVEDNIVHKKDDTIEKSAIEENVRILMCKDLREAKTQENQRSEVKPDEAKSNVVATNHKSIETEMPHLRGEPQYLGTNLGVVVRDQRLVSDGNTLGTFADALSGVRSDRSVKEGFSRSVEHISETSETQNRNDNPNFVLPSSTAMDIDLPEVSYYDSEKPAERILSGNDNKLTDSNKRAVECVVTVCSKALKPLEGEITPREEQSDMRLSSSEMSDVKELRTSKRNFDSQGIQNRESSMCEGKTSSCVTVVQEDKSFFDIGSSDLKKVAEQSNNTNKGALLKTGVSRSGDMLEEEIALKMEDKFHKELQSVILFLLLLLTFEFVTWLMRTNKSWILIFNKYKFSVNCRRKNRWLDRERTDSLTKRFIAKLSSDLYFKSILNIPDRFKFHVYAARDREYEKKILTDNLQQTVQDSNIRSSIMLEYKSFRLETFSLIPDVPVNKQRLATQGFYCDENRQIRCCGCSAEYNPLLENTLTLHLDFCIFGIYGRRKTYVGTDVDLRDRMVSLGPAPTQRVRTGRDAGYSNPQRRSYHERAVRDISLRESAISHERAGAQAFPHGSSVSSRQSTNHETTQADTDHCSSDGMNKYFSGSEAQDKKNISLENDTSIISSNRQNSVIIQESSPAIQANADIRNLPREATPSHTINRIQAKESASCSNSVEQNVTQITSADFSSLRMPEQENISIPPKTSLGTATAFRCYTETTLIRPEPPDHNWRGQRPPDYDAVCPERQNLYVSGSLLADNISRQDRNYSPDPYMDQLSVQEDDFSDQLREETAAFAVRSLPDTRESSDSNGPFQDEAEGCSDESENTEARSSIEAPEKNRGQKRREM